MGGCLAKGQAQENLNISEDKVTQRMYLRTLSLNCVLKNSPKSIQLCNKLIAIISQRTKRTIKNITLVFRASQHKFKAEVFHEMCSKKANTVLIAYSTTNKIFGAFTPCSWEKDQYITYGNDENRQSFLFAVEDGNINTYNIKQGSQQYAIMNDQQLGPVFGQGHDIHISNEADKHVSWNNQGKSYACDHKFGSIKANTTLCDEEKYKLKEYQIWQVHLS